MNKRGLWTEYYHGFVEVSTLKSSWSRVRVVGRRRSLEGRRRGSLKSASASARGAPCVELEVWNRRELEVWNRRRHLSRSLIKWKCLPFSESTWDDTSGLHHRFPNLDLGDKVSLKEGGNDGPRRSRRDPQKNRLFCGDDYVT